MNIYLKKNKKIKNDPKNAVEYKPEKNKKIINEPKNAIEYKPEKNILPALQYNPTNNNNSDYINPIPSTWGTQKKSEIPSTSIKRKKSENNELLTKKSKIHIKGKNSF